jgi:hypothetical protein
VTGPEDGSGTVLTAPVSATVPSGTLDQLRARLSAGVADALAGVADGGRIEVGLPQLRRARYRPDLLGLPDEPFVWKPAFVRRSLGIAAVRACAAGRFRAPAAAVGPVADEALEDWRRSGRRTFHWEPWFAGLGPGGRASVLAESITWATPVWGALDWIRLGPSAELGRPDDAWVVPGTGAVRLRGRSEARIAVAGPDGRPAGGPVLLSVAGGRPGDGWRRELAFLALVAGLAFPARPVPTRVVGLWPESGDLQAVDVDDAALSGAVDRVVDTVAVTADVGGAARVAAMA